MGGEEALNSSERNLTTSQNGKQKLDFNGKKTNEELIDIINQMQLQDDRQKREISFLWQVSKIHQNFELVFRYIYSENQGKTPYWYTAYVV